PPAGTSGSRRREDQALHALEHPASKAAVAELSEVRRVEVVAVAGVVIAEQRDGAGGSVAMQSRTPSLTFRWSIVALYIDHSARCHAPDWLLPNAAIVVIKITRAITCGRIIMISLQLILRSKLFVCRSNERAVPRGACARRLRSNRSRCTR